MACRYFLKNIPFVSKIILKIINLNKKSLFWIFVMLFDDLFDIKPFEGFRLVSFSFSEKNSIEIKRYLSCFPQYKQKTRK